jgi:hypothetical protein
MQEGLMITLQTGLYSGVCSYGAVQLLSWSTSAYVAALAATIVGGPIAGMSVWAGGCMGAACGINMAAYVGAAGGGIASLSRIVQKYSKKNSQNALNIEPLSLNSIDEKTIEPLILEKDK